jgi:hypothetical protein
MPLCHPVSVNPAGMLAGKRGRAFFHENASLGRPLGLINQTRFYNQCYFFLGYSVLSLLIHTLRVL